MSAIDMHSAPPTARRGSGFARQSGLWILALALAAGCHATALGPSAIPAERVQSPRQADFDVENYALAIDLDPVLQRIAGRATIRLTPRESKLSEIRLDFVDLKVRQVLGDGGVALEFSHEEGVLLIQLPRALRQGDFAEISVVYDGAPRRGLYFTDVEDGVATQVFTQGECEDSRGWFPCFDFPNERATSEIAVTMPAAWTSVAAGERVERRELDGGRALERWRMGTPHAAYLTTLVAGEFVTRTADWQGVPLLYLADPTLAPYMDARFLQTPNVLEFLSTLTGVRYPYPKYSQAAVANFQFGGMENISATTLTDTWLTDELGERDSPPGGLIAHEAAHQWFGDLLTCADWSHIWLNEGWATYATELYVEATQGTDAFETSMAGVREGYLNADVGAARRPMVFDRYRDPMDLFTSGHAYPGGASRLHQLRFELGDELFYAGVRRYFADHRGTAVTTRDFQHSMEAASGRDLSKFFTQWFRTPGYPEFEMRWSWDGDGDKLTVEIEQTQASSGGTPKAFRTPAEVEIVVGSGASATTVVERVEIDERRSRFIFDVAARPRWVLFDPHGWLVAKTHSQKSDNEWVAIAENCPHPLARREALAELAGLAQATKDSRARALYAQVFEARLASDDSLAVRSAAARALATLAPTLGSVALLKAASGDVSSAVRIAALAGLAGFAPDQRLKEFAQEQFDACYSWGTMAAAAALGAQADPGSAFETLTQALKIRSPHDVLAAALVGTLAGLQDPRAVDELERILASPESSARLREAAVRGLGRTARARPQVRRNLEALLGDSDYRLRGAAIDALANLQDAQALPALQRAYPTLVDSRQRRAVEAILRAPWAAAH